MNRYKAASLHLLGSACALFFAFFLVKYIWYPGKLFSAAPGGALMRVLVGVDLIVGPLIMLIIFDVKKKLIKLDIAIVLLCQFTFLAYGVWSIYAARPVYLVFVDNHFCLVRANEIEAADLAKVQNQQFKKLPNWGPVYVGVHQPTDPKVREDILFGGLGGMGIQNLPQYFVPYTQVQQQVKAAAKTGQQLKGIDMEIRQKLENYEKTKPANSVLFLTLVYKQMHLEAVVDAKTGEVIEFI